MCTEEKDPEFVHCLEKILCSPYFSEVEDGWSNLEKMDEIESGSKNSTYDCNLKYDKYLRSLLKKDNIINIEQIPRILEWFSQFPIPNNGSKSMSEDIAEFLRKYAKHFKSKPCIAEILEKIDSNSKKYIGDSDNKCLCQAIVQVISWIYPPSPQRLADMEKYYDDLKKIKNFMKQKNTPINSFNELKEIFNDKEREVNEPSFSLVIVIELVDQALWAQHMEVLVKVLVENLDQTVIVKMLSLFCKWLIQPHSNYTAYISWWLVLFIEASKSMKNVRIPSNVAHLVLPGLLIQTLSYEEGKKFFDIEPKHNIILQLCYYIPSLEIYHQILNPIKEIIQINGHYDKPSKGLENYLDDFINIVLSNRFNNHKCDKCEEMMTLMKELKKVRNNQSIHANIPEESEMEICYSSPSGSLGKLETKVGLKNLGNTCYANSVLQALAMTRQFCREVLLYKSTVDLSKQIVLKNLQNLFAMLKYSFRHSLAPTEILHTSKPSYFMPGQQQDSSEFLCHLLDVLYEQEKSALMQNCNNDQSSATKSKVEDKEMIEVVEEDTGTLNLPITDNSTPGNMTRWTTEENLSEGEELAQTQNVLSDTHSDSTDSGIQSVGGEDSTSSSSYLVHRVFGGELKVTYKCCKCTMESHNTDRFRDLQLCFPDNLDVTKLSVQELIKVNYLLPEILTDDNKYRCDKCAELCDAERLINILQTPAHLILTLKHFCRYDSESGLRTKLRRKVYYNDKISLPVDKQSEEKYQLYAAVVHSGYCMDYGHYITYACDSQNCWYKLNDNYVCKTTIEEFHRLEPPDTPYILFYKRCSDEAEEDTPELTSLSKNLQEYIEQDKQKFSEERRNSRTMIASHSKFNYKTNDKKDDDDGNPPPSNCRGPVSISQNPVVF